MMSKIYDNWEKLVGAVLRREKDRELAFCESFSTTYSSESSSRFSFEIPSDSDVYLPADTIPEGHVWGNKLVFFEWRNHGFDMDELLRSSAEFLGKGTFGTAYKAIMEDGTTVVVKRLKEVNVGKRDFEKQMNLIGSIKHENVATLRACYYSKDEKLMVRDYYSQGSLSQMLHGKRGLKWESIVKIAIGAARGIARIHAQNMAHGNVKSSNIFLNSKHYGCVSDLCLAAIMSSVPQHNARAPEVTDTRKATQRSDVYSFGVILLELLTAKPPILTMNGDDEIIHLIRWVREVYRTTEILDVELLKYPNIEEEFVEMLQIAISCVVKIPEQRPKMSEVVKMIENVRPAEATKTESSTTPIPSSPGV